MVNMKTGMAGIITSNNMKPAEDEDVYHISPSGSRRLGREIALQGLYAIEFNGDTINKTMRDIFSFYQETSAVFEFATDMMQKTDEHREELDRHIRQHATNWDFDRIAIIDRLVLRMAICEFLYFWDIPPKVSIDEAIELSKMYSTEQSGRFVNGILDAVLLDLKKTGQMVKSGRGLQEGENGRAEEIDNSLKEI